MQRSPGRAVARADQRIDGLVHVGIRHDDGVVLGAAKTLRTLAGGGGALIDILRDRRGTDEADGADIGIVEDGVDGFLSPLTTLRMPGGKPASIIKAASAIGTPGSRSEVLGRTRCRRRSRARISTSGSSPGNEGDTKPAPASPSWRIDRCDASALGHLAIQFPGDDPDVEIRARDRLRQRVRPKTVGARSRGADGAGGLMIEAGLPPGISQRRQRRQGSRRRHPRRSRYPRRRLRRFLADRAIYL